MVHLCNIYHRDIKNKIDLQARMKIFLTYILSENKSKSKGMMCITPVFVLVCTNSRLRLWKQLGSVHRETGN